MPTSEERKQRAGVRADSRGYVIERFNPRLKMYFYYEARFPTLTAVEEAQHFNNIFSQYVYKAVKK